MPDPALPRRTPCYRCHKPVLESDAYWLRRQRARAEYFAVGDSLYISSHDPYHRQCIPPMKFHAAKAHSFRVAPGPVDHWFLTRPSQEHWSEAPTGITERVRIPERFFVPGELPRWID